MTKIVVVDDDADTLALVAGAIHLELGYEVLAFLDPVDALECIIADLSIDAIVTDEKMPSSTGLQLLERAVKAGYKGHMFVFSGYAGDSMSFDLLQIEMAASSNTTHSEVVEKPAMTKLLAVLKQAIDPADDFDDNFEITDF